MGYSNVIFNGQSLNFGSMSIQKRPKTIKQSLGKKVVILGEAIGTNAIEHVIRAQGDIRGADLDANKATLEASQDGQRHAYSDGVRSGDYAILELSFNDQPGIAGLAKYSYTITLVEW